MAKKEYSAYQSELIGRYYNNMDNIMLQKLSELVSELYLAEDDAKKEKLWQRVEKAMGNLGIKDGLAKHIMQKKDVEILAKNLQDWLAVANKKKV
jgi:hypothetical protein